MRPVEVGGLDADTGEGDSLDGVRSVLFLDPLGGRRPIGEEEEKEGTEGDSDGSEDVEDEPGVRVAMQDAKSGEPRYSLPSRRGLITESLDTSSHQSTNHASPSDGRVPDGLSERDLVSAVPPSSHEGQSGCDGGFEHTEEESSDHDMGKVLGEHHDKYHHTPDKC